MRYTEKLDHVTLRFQVRVVYINQPKSYNSSNSKVIYKKVNKQIAYFGDARYLCGCSSTPHLATGRAFSGGACLAPVPQPETPVPTMRIL